MRPPSIQNVLHQELQQVEASRALRLGPDPQRPKAASSLIGLAFSGGGIRSATFNLGVLQALARKRLLRSLDYLSTVSGGGYIGGWLMGWMHHRKLSILDIEAQLATLPEAPRQASDPPEVHFLRDYSNYLTPRKGVLRADFLAFAASYIRNTLLNQIILVLALLSLLLVPRTIVFFLHALEDLEEALRPSLSDAVQPYMEAQYFALALGLLSGLLAVIFIGLNLETVDPHEGKRDRWFAYPWAVHLFIVIPLLLSSALFTYGCSQFLTKWGILDHPEFRAPLMGLGLYFGLWSGACLVRRFFHAARVRKEEKAAAAPATKIQNGAPLSWLVMLTAALTGWLIGYLFLPFSKLLIPADHTFYASYSKWFIITFGTPAAILIMLIAGMLHIGLMGRGMSDAHREWWGRLGGLLMLFAICWLALFLIAVYFPAGLGWLLNKATYRYHITVTSAALWVLSTAYGVFFGKSEKTSKWNPDASWIKKLLTYGAKLTPYIFILGLLLLLSLLASFAANQITGLTGQTLSIPSDMDFDYRVPLLCILCFLGALAVSWRVDINEFSVHYLYRNRLVRCYLGASVLDRNGQPFTGFSEKDNLPLKDLRIPFYSKDPRGARPLPIFNTSLNVVRGKELALQTRKARSFALTPLFGGFTRAVPGKREWDSFYAPTARLACKLPGFKDGVTLGTAVAISGAAASPNMGFYSDSGLAFLMTLFDVRLGWWVGNPCLPERDNGSPRIGFLCLLEELLGLASDESKYVYLSDGGHFENLAVYELVRRRCKLIIASDASCDSGYAFGDLQNAIERCRTDFGVEITLDGLDQLTPKAAPEGGGIGPCAQHFALGKIHYDPDSPEDDGTIIYLKPALVPGDPVDVLGYARKNECFPHDTTANQWFDEAHFESYRALGFATGEAACKAITDAIQHILAHTSASSPSNGASSPIPAATPVVTVP
jgi:hypothetical protein